MDSDGYDPRPRRAPSNTLLAILVLLLATWLAISQVIPLFRRPSASPRAITPRESLPDVEKTVINLFQQAAPSVVFVTTEAYVRNMFNVGVQRGSGSGFVWDDTGLIVTNLHVVRAAQRVTVTLADQSTWTARIIGYSSRHDLAVLKIDAPAVRLVPIPLGSSADLQVGQSVFAIGNPFGLDQTLTTGVISALHRDIQAGDDDILRDVIQTDAAINPGNSGGPLLDSAGRLIGVNTAIYSPSGASAGIGFAVPVDAVNQVVPDLIAHGREMKPWMGVELVPTSQVPAPIDAVGLILRDVVPGSPAAAAGLVSVLADRVENGQRLFDVITAIDGSPTPDVNSYRRIMDNHKAGDTIRLTIRRGQQTLDVPVTLGAAPAQ